MRLTCDEPGLERAQAWNPVAMNRGAGTGLIGFGIVLGVIGAIMTFAVSVHTEGFSVHDAGVILLIVGIIVTLLGTVIFAMGSRSRSTSVENVQATPTGQHRVEEHSEWAP
jgi:uncharacterized membrane protein